MFHNQPLQGIRVVEAATLFAGPLAAMHLGDFGAEVIKIEHPEKPDPARGHGPSKDGENLWYKSLGRNKEHVAIKLSTASGAEILLRLLADADVFIENFRPGVLDSWGITLERMLEVNPSLVVVRITAFGQTGPYAGKPGFGTLAEAMSGFAATTGFPDGPPVLPPFGLADGITGIAGAFAALVGLQNRNLTGSGGEVDLSILEPMMMMLGPQISAYAALGYVQPRTGNRSVNNAPRNIYRSADDCWIAISTSSQSVAERVMKLVGRADLIDQDWFSSGKGRAEHADLLDEVVGSWIGSREAIEVLDAFEAAEAAAAKILSVRELVADPQVVARGVVSTRSDEKLGAVSVQNPLFKFNGEYPEIKWLGKSHGLDTEVVLQSLGYSPQEIQALVMQGVVR